MHKPDCGCPALSPQRGDEIPCCGCVGEQAIIEGKATEVVGTGREMHDDVAAARRTHGFVHGFPVGQVTDSSIGARMPADRHDLVAMSPQSRHRRRPEIPRSPGDENPHACTTDWWQRSRNVTNEKPSCFRSRTSLSSLRATPARPRPKRSRCG